MIIFEDLPNEIIIMIFSYLSAIPVYKFYNLNLRLNMIISSLKLKLKFSSNNSKLPVDLKHNIKSVDTWIFDISAINNLPNLEYFKSQIFINSSIYKSVLRNPSVNKISIHIYFDQSEYSNDFPKNYKITSAKLNFLTLETFSIIIQTLPNLKVCHLNIYSNWNFITDKKLYKLTKLSIYSSSKDFFNLDIILKSTPNIKELFFKVSVITHHDFKIIVRKLLKLDIKKIRFYFLVDHYDLRLLNEKNIRYKKASWNYFFYEVEYNVKWNECLL